MRLVIDTNVLISALFGGKSLPVHLILQWHEGHFDLLTSAEQVGELVRVTRYPHIRDRLTPSLTGRMINDIRILAISMTRLPVVTASPDPDDNYLLAMAAAGSADFLVTGDKRHLLAIKRHRGTRIITVRDFLVLHGRMP